jgi:hypothetical protein
MQTLDITNVCSTNRPLAVTSRVEGGLRVLEKSVLRNVPTCGPKGEEVLVRVGACGSMSVPTCGPKGEKVLVRVGTCGSMRSVPTCGPKGEEVLVRVGACGSMRKKEIHTGFWCGCLQEGDIFEDLDLDGNMM